jgi:hypothetical protein
MGEPLTLSADEFAALKTVVAALGRTLSLAPGSAADDPSIVRLCPTCLHDGVLEATLDRAAAAEAKLAEYENAITWNTSCTSCARVLDSSYAETVRREQAEAKLAAVRASLLDAQNAIGQVLRYAGTLEMEGGQFAEAGRWLTDTLAPWTGEVRSEEGSGS